MGGVLRRNRIWRWFKFFPKLLVSYERKNSNSEVEKPVRHYLKHVTSISVANKKYRYHTPPKDTTSFPCHSHQRLKEKKNESLWRWKTVFWLDVGRLKKEVTVRNYCTVADHFNVIMRKLQKCKLRDVLWDNWSVLTHSATFTKEGTMEELSQIRESRGSACEGLERHEEACYWKLEGKRLLSHSDGMLNCMVTYRLLESWTCK